MSALADSSKRWHIVLRCMICGPLGLLFHFPKEGVVASKTFAFASRWDLKGVVQVINFVMDGVVILNLYWKVNHKQLDCKCN